MLKNSMVRCDEEDRKMILALSKAGLKMPVSDVKINTSSRVVRMLLEFWINADPEVNIPAMYRGKYTLNVPGISLQWDKEHTPGEIPAYIQLSKFIEKSPIEEVRLIRDTRTGEIKFQSLGNPDDYFTGELPSDEIEEDDQECEEDVKIYPYRNTETGETRYGNTGKHDNEEFMKVLYNHTTGETREVKRDEYCLDGETEVQLYQDEAGEIYYQYQDEDPEDTPEPEQPAPEYIELSREDITRKGK